MDEKDKKIEKKFLEAVRQCHGIKDSDGDWEGKLKKFMEMEYQYTEMGEYLHKMSLDLGIAYDRNEKLREEFKAILDPAGFFVWGGR